MNWMKCITRRCVIQCAGAESLPGAASLLEAGKMVQLLLEQRMEELARNAASVLTFDPRGRIFGRSADYPYVKVFDDTAVFEMTTFIENCPAVA